MLTLLGGILTLALAAAVVVAVVLTYNWFKNKIREKLEVERARKVAAADVKFLIKNCKNKMTLDALDALDELDEKGCTHLIATLDDNDEVIDIDTLKDTSSTKDMKVYNAVNRTGEGMLIIEK